MAILYITEYAVPNREKNLKSDYPVEPAVADQTVSFTSNTASAAFNSATSLVRLVSDTDCHIEFHATTPVATASHQFLPADTEIFRYIGSATKVAAYDGIT